MNSTNSLRVVILAKKEESLELFVQALLDFHHGNTADIILESQKYHTNHFEIQFKYHADFFEGELNKGILMVQSSAKDASGTKLVVTGPEITNVNFLPSTNTWVELRTQSHTTMKIELFFKEYIDESAVEFPFACLMDDDELCDFELLTNGTGEGEAPYKIQVHKAVLAASSPVLRRMLSSDFKEKSQGFVEVPADLATLQAFKQFLYVRSLPSDIKLLEQLVRFGSYYMIPELEKKAVQALAGMATERNAYDILEFAFENKTKKLSMAIFKKMGSTIDLDKMEMNTE